MLIVTASRQEALGPGNFDWRRWPLGVGPSLRVSAAGLAWDFDAGPALAWLHLAGNLFDHTARPEGIAWGGFLNVRAASRGHWGAFALVDGQFYPAESRVYANGVNGDRVLPSFSLIAAMGGRFSP
jgi:hypothetical protein